MSEWKKDILEQKEARNALWEAKHGKLYDFEHDDSIEGVFLEMDYNQEYESYNPKIQVPDGTVYRLKGRGILMDKLATGDIVEGDQVKIECLGKEKGRRYFNYRVWIGKSGGDLVEIEPHKNHDGE